MYYYNGKSKNEDVKMSASQSFEQEMKQLDCTEENENATSALSFHCHRKKSQAKSARTMVGSWMGNAWIFPLPEWYLLSVADIQQTFSG